MLRGLIKLGQTLAAPRQIRPIAFTQPILCRSYTAISRRPYTPISCRPTTPILCTSFLEPLNVSFTPACNHSMYKAWGKTKLQYLDFRHKFRMNRARHMLAVRRKKMMKHQRKKWRKKFKSMLQKRRFQRIIAKEKSFRVELLYKIRKAEEFDPKEYALRKLAAIYDQPREMSRKERLEDLKEKIRVNRYQVDYVKPKHRRADI